MKRLPVLQKYALVLQLKTEQDAKTFKEEAKPEKLEHRTYAHLSRVQQVRLHFEESE